MIFALLVSSVVNAIPPICVCACSWGGPQTGLTMTDAVFVGLVTDVRDTSVSSAIVDDSTPTRWLAQRITIKVARGWKKPGANEVQVLDIQAGSSCASDLPKGQAVVVYAKWRHSRLILWGCGSSTNKPLTRAQTDLAELGPPSF